MTPLDPISEPEPENPAVPAAAAFDLADSKLESLARMAGGLSHEFNNLLLAILGNADLLAQEMGPDAAGRELLDEIKAASRRAADICARLLAFAGRGHFNVDQIDLNEIVRGMVGMLQTAVPRRASLRLDLAADLPLIDADVPHLQQAIMNLVVNASDALGEDSGTIVLRTGRSATAAPAEMTSVLAAERPGEEFGYVEVADDGCGMSAAVLRRAFDPFFSTRPRGRGLGLASVLGIMRGHHGALHVRTRPGGGTCARLSFPCSRLAPIAGTARRAGSRVTGRTVLLVDDDEFLRLLGERMLRRLGHEVITAEDGLGALIACDEHRGRIDLVLLDLVMPGMDGVEVLQRLCSLAPHVPVVMTSGYHEREISHRIDRRGIAGFLQKPYELDELARVLEAVFSAKREAQGQAD